MAFSIRRSLCFGKIWKIEIETEQVTIVGWFENKARAIRIVVLDQVKICTRMVGHSR